MHKPVTLSLIKTSSGPKQQVKSDRFQASDWTPYQFLELEHPEPRPVVHVSPVS